MRSKELKNWRVVQWRRDTKRKAVEYLGGKCKECGYSGSFAVFDFHHPDPSKKDFGIGGYSKGWEKLRVELDKCILLCSNCHRDLHDKIWSAQHAHRIPILESKHREPGVSTACAYCNTPIRVPTWKFKNRPHHFCNRDHFYAFMRGKRDPWVGQRAKRDEDMKPKTKPVKDGPKNRGRLAQ